jgi:hypothetical protein
MFQYYLGDAWRLRGKMHGLEGQEDEAESAFQKSRDILNTVSEQIEDADYRDALAQTLSDFAAFKQSTNANDNHEEVIRLLEQAETLRQEACELSPSSKDLRQKLEQLQQTLQEQRMAE